ncbi:MAG: chemotaxis protein CheW [Leptolyngbyaceae cyanobacterium SM2_5_2]|nr:chemotaxis protein CheW [Leptolyngbyaceae cyanobacterium SM2_5_2]
MTTEVEAIIFSEADQALEISMATDNSSLEEQFLQIYLWPELPLLLPVQNLVEILKLSLNQVVPMFQMSPWVMGVYNWRGDMLWVADLGHFLGLAPWYEQAEPTTNHSVVVLNTSASATSLAGEAPTSLGCLVRSVQGMVTGSVQKIPLGADLGEIPSSLMPFLKGRLVTKEGQSRFILDGVAVLEIMAQSHL